MAGKKKWKQRAKAEKHIGDELFIQVGMLSGQLQAVDNLLCDAVLEGPTIDAWAQQVRDLLTSLVRERGLVRSRYYPPDLVEVSVASPRRQNQASDDGTYQFLSDDDLKPFSQETRNVITGTSVPAGEGRFA